MKPNRLNWILMSTIIVLSAIGVANAQGNDEKRGKKIEIKKEVTDDGESILLRIEKADGSIFEKSYSNEEEMRNDPDLKGMNYFHFDDTEEFIFSTGEDQDGKYEVIINGDDGERSKRVLMFKSEDGFIHEFNDGEAEWIQKFEEGKDQSNIFLRNDGGDAFKIQKDENGEILIEKNGVLMDIEELAKDGKTKVDVGEDGSIKITQGDENGQSIMIFKNSDGNNFTMNLSDDKIWKIDSLRNEFFTEESEDGIYIIGMDVETDVDGEGNKRVIVHKKVEKVRVEIQDLNNPEEISEVPGLLINEGKDLSLEDVDYYPNPSQGKFSLRFKGKKKPIQIKILDLRGQEIFVENINDFDGLYDNLIDLSGSEPGLYVLQVIQNNKSWTKKIVIE